MPATAPQSRRYYGCDLEIAQLGTTGTPAMLDLLSIFTNIEIEFSMDVMEARVAKDAGDVATMWSYPRMKSKSWKASCEGLLSNDEDDTQALLFNLGKIFGTSTYEQFVLTIKGPGVAGKRMTVSGDCHAESTNFNMGGEAATQGISLIGDGPLTVGKAGA